jgi:hypothetical protein
MYPLRLWQEVLLGKRSVHSHAEKAQRRVDTSTRGGTEIECEDCKGVFFETVQQLVDHFDQVHDLRE